MIRNTTTSTPHQHHYNVTSQNHHHTNTTTTTPAPPHHTTATTKTHYIVQHHHNTAISFPHPYAGCLLAFQITTLLLVLYLALSKPLMILIKPEKWDCSTVPCGDGNGLPLSSSSLSSSSLSSSLCPPPPPSHLPLLHMYSSLFLTSTVLPYVLLPLFFLLSSFSYSSLRSFILSPFPCPALVLLSYSTFFFFPLLS